MRPKVGTFASGAILGGLVYGVFVLLSKDQETSGRVVLILLGFLGNFSIKFKSAKVAFDSGSPLPFSAQVITYVLLAVTFTALSEFYQDGVGLDVYTTQAAMAPFTFTGLYLVNKQIF